METTGKEPLKFDQTEAEVKKAVTFFFDWLRIALAWLTRNLVKMRDVYIFAAGVIVGMILWSFGWAVALGFGGFVAGFYFGKRFNK